MNDQVCLSIRFAPGVVDRVAAIVYGREPGRRETLDGFLGEVFDFVGRQGFEVSSVGGRTMCIRGSTAAFEAAFDTVAPKEGWDAKGFRLVDQDRLNAVAARLPGFISDIAMQRSFSATAVVGDWPPPAPPAGCLDTSDVARLLGAHDVHAKGFKGSGVTVVVFDSEFAFDHAFFAQNRADFGPPPGAQNARGGAAMASGHGTAMAALVVAMAPEAKVIGIRLRDDVLLEGLNDALHLPSLPDILSISLTKDMCDRTTGTCWTDLPLDLVHVADEVNSAVAHGVAVVAGAGNGDYGFPAAMRQVIAVGGVEIDPARNGARKVWDGGSAFQSRITSGDCANRFVPDVCGLAGLDRGAYIVLPVPPGSRFERDFPLPRGTAGTDGWALFSGTSAATAQVAGVSALLLQRHKGLKPAQLRNLLCNTARDVTDGNASELSNLPNAKGIAAVGPGGQADGFGLVDALKAWTRANMARSIDDLAER